MYLYKSKYYSTTRTTNNKKWIIITRIIQQQQHLSLLLVLLLLLLLLQLLLVVDAFVYNNNNCNYNNYNYNNNIQQPTIISTEKLSSILILAASRKLQLSSLSSSSSSLLSISSSNNYSSKKSFQRRITTTKRRRRKIKRATKCRIRSTIQLPNYLSSSLSSIIKTTIVPEPTKVSVLYFWNNNNNNNNKDDTSNNPNQNNNNNNNNRRKIKEEYNDLNGYDRYRACIPYILPLIDADPFGYFIYHRITPLGFVDEILLQPLVYINQNIPFLGVGLFILLTLGTRLYAIDTMDRNVRYNAQLAALIDITLLIPELIGSSFRANNNEIPSSIAAPEFVLPLSIVEPCSNFVWYYSTCLIAYCIISNLRGKKPDQIPYLSSYADYMTGPF